VSDQLSQKMSHAENAFVQHCECAFGSNTAERAVYRRVWEAYVEKEQRKTTPLEISDSLALHTLTPEGYGPFVTVLMDALKQTASGKGENRHGHGLPFCDQQITTESLQQGHPGFVVGQARKKLLESLRLEPKAAYKEVLGAIVYAVAAGLFYCSQEEVGEEE